MNSELYGNKGADSCVGTIIDDKTIVTAAYLGCHFFQLSLTILFLTAADVNLALYTSTILTGLNQEFSQFFKFGHPIFTVSVMSDKPICPLCPIRAAMWIGIVGKTIIKP